jgi:hypothetical protein
MPSVDDRADAFFAAQDREARHDARLAAREAGLEHLLPAVLNLRADEVSPPSPSVAALPGAAAPRRSRVTEALHKIASPRARCMCPPCVAVRAERIAARK